MDELGLVGRRQRGLLLGQRLLQLVLDAHPEVVLAQPPVVEQGAELVDQMVMDLLPELVEDGVPTAGARGRADLMEALGE